MAKIYDTPLIPGPTSVPEYVRSQYLINYGSADLEDEYFELYAKTSQNIQKFLNANNTSVVIMSGEGMVALWGAMKSVLRPGDKVLSVSSGLFGDGFAEMAECYGCSTKLIKCLEGEEPNQNDVRQAANEFRPKLITAVHCETPSGLLNNVQAIGQIAKEVGALFLVDFVSSAGSTELNVDDWGIDLGLLGSQKCLSCLPDLGIITVSPKAWEAVRDVKYCGYDAMLPFEHALEKKTFPYTPNWHAMAALNTSLEHILNVEGLQNVFKRHQDVARYTREEVRKMGLKTYPLREELNAPSVTAVHVPDGWTWKELDAQLRQRKVFIGGTWGHLADKIFRIGHMGSQANMEIIQHALSALKEILETKK